MSKEFKDFQIIRMDAKNSFVEVLSSMLDKGKLIFNFIQYDDKKESGNKIIREIPIFMDIEEAKLLFERALNGSLNRDRLASLQAQKDGGFKYPKAFYSSLGGTSAEVLKRRGQERPDKMSESRALYIVPSTSKNASWMLEAKRGPGERHQTGLISPKGSFKDFEVIRIPLSTESFMTLMIVTRDAVLKHEIIEELKEDVLIDMMKNQQRIINGLSHVYKKVVK